MMSQKMVIPGLLPCFENCISYTIRQFNKNPRTVTRPENNFLNTLRPPAEFERRPPPCISPIHRPAG